MNLLSDFSRLEKCRVLVVGDLMLDRYLWGEVERISPEAPVPVFRIKRQSEIRGGAGNVVSNLIGLGCHVSVVGVLGTDEGGQHLKRLMQDERIGDCLVEIPGVTTTIKTRVVSMGQQLIRLDKEQILPLDQAEKQEIISRVKDRLNQLDAIILSDYGKGVLLTPGLAQELIALGRDRSIPVLVDPKGRNWARYRGATCITPNSKELELFAGESADDNGRLVIAMERVMRSLELEWLLVTRGALGMCLMGRDGAPLFIASQARQVYDVSGAGDTVISTLALAAAARFEFYEAARLANLAAGIVVAKLGTQPVNSFELMAAWSAHSNAGSGLPFSKVLTKTAAALQAEAWKARREKIVFTNGCFDLLHPGHIHLLNRARELGQRLIVGLNSDSSVARLKGPSRPILSEQDRAAVLGSLDCVDAVVIFGEETPENLIRTLKPDVLVKGSDYRKSEVVGSDIVKSYGGSVHLIQLLDGYSTTNIAGKIMASDRRPPSREDATPGQPD